MLAVAPQLIRAVTHLDVSRSDVEQAGSVLRAVAEAAFAKA
jgi:threonine aldolase